MKRKRVIGAMSVALAAVLGLTSCASGDEGGVTGDTTAVSSTEAAISIADAALSVSADRDAVTVNSQPLGVGEARRVVPGDTVAVDQAGTALLSAEAVFEVEALRNAQLTVPDLSQGGAATVPLAAGHVFVRLNPAANATVVIDAGERQFTTKSPDAEFALCQAPDGASCLAVLQGSVEWAEEGVATELYEGGQATFAPRGNAPLPTRCADDAALGAMQRTLRGVDFGGALAEIVADWEVCPGQEEAAPATPTLPSAAGMEHVTAATITVGYPQATSDGPNVAAPRTLEGGADFYIEPVTVTNALFRAWLVRAAGDDASAWRRLAPADWLERAPGGAATQSTYADGTADEPVKGITWATAGEYCAAQGKRLPTEVEWELAAVGDVFTDLADESQDWVDKWEAYGPGPTDAAGRQVLRGANGTLKADRYYRVFAPEAPEATAARLYARIRCAADQVAIGGRTFPTVVVEDDFNGLGWPTTDDNGFELGYHPENYHLDVSKAHAQLAVVRAVEQPLTEGRVDVATFIERNNTGTSTGEHRFGLLVGTKEQLYMLSVQPDEKGRTAFIACFTPVEPALADELGLAGDALSASDSGRFAGLGPDSVDYNRDCNEAEEPKSVTVTSIDSPLELSVVLADGKVEAWVNEVLVSTSDQVSAIGIYGFAAQNYNRTRSHTHIDQVTISAA